MARCLILCVLCVFLTAGCATRFAVKVDSITDPSASAVGKSYVLFSGMKDVPEGDLLFREFSSYVRYALNEHGYEEARNPEEAQLAVYFSYGISAGTTVQYSYTRPIYEYVGGETVTYAETRRGASGKPERTKGTVYVPYRRELVGLERGTGSYPVYTAYAVIEARDNTVSNTEEEIQTAWKTTVKVTSKSDDLRVIIPVMAAASGPYLGENTGEQITIRLSEKDSRVTQMRRSSPPTHR